MVVGTLALSVIFGERIDKAVIITPVNNPSTKHNRNHFFFSIFTKIVSSFGWSSLKFRIIIEVYLGKYNSDEDFLKGKLKK